MCISICVNICYSIKLGNGHVDGIKLGKGNVDSRVSS